MFKIAIDGVIHPAGVAMLDARADLEYQSFNKDDAADMAATIAGADVIIARAGVYSETVLAGANQLKLLARHGVGYDHIDVEALSRRGIPLMVAGTANAVSVAEQTFALLLYLCKQIQRYDQGVRSGDYRIREDMRMFEIAGKVMLIVGFGRIGTRVAKRAAAFDADIIVADPYIARNTVEGLGYRYVADFHDALAEADIVTLHLPGHYDGTAVLGADEFTAMKDGAVLINCARGTLIDEAALIAALDCGKLVGAGLDVTRQEPPPLDNPLLSRQDVVLSPHAAASSRESYYRMTTYTVQNILDFVDGCPNLANVINHEVLGK